MGRYLHKEDCQRRLTEANNVLIVTYGFLVNISLWTEHSALLAYKCTHAHTHTHARAHAHAHTHAHTRSTVGKKCQAEDFTSNDVI